MRTLWLLFFDLLVTGQIVKPQSGFFLPYKGPDRLLHLKHLTDALLSLLFLGRDEDVSRFDYVSLQQPHPQLNYLFLLKCLWPEVLFYYLKQLSDVNSLSRPGEECKTVLNLILSIYQAIIFHTLSRIRQAGIRW